MRDVLLILISLAVGAVLAVLGTLGVIDDRHDCWPHDRETCKRKAGEW